MPEPEWWEIGLKILTGVTPFVVAVGGILLYLSQLRWSKKFIAAKDETIKAKEAHITLLEREIKSLQELNPVKLREYYNATRQGLEECISSLQQETQEKDRAAQELIAQGQQGSI